MKENIMKVGENMISRKINDYCLIMTCNPIFSTHTRALTQKLFQDRAFSCRVCSAPR